MNHFLALAFTLVLTTYLKSQTVQIGDQTWQSENLGVVTFRNGDTLIEAKSLKEWKRAEKQKKGAWCYYDNKSANGKKYGKLYNVYAVTDPRGLAPEGFHIPSNEEWEQLGKSLDGLKKAGLKLKSSSDWDGDNSSGFNGMPGGIRYANGPDGKGGAFDNMGKIGYYWSSRRDVWFLKLKKKSLNKIPSSSGCYLSVRCIAD